MKDIKIKTVYVPVKVEEDNLPKQEVCALNDSNMLVGHLRYHGKGVIRPIVFVEDEHQEMGNITHWLNEQQLITFTPEQLNQLLSDVIKDALYQATQFVELQYECGKKTKEGCVAVFCNNCFEQVDNSSIYSTFDKIFEKWKI